MDSNMELYLVFERFDEGENAGVELYGVFSTYELAEQARVKLQAALAVELIELFGEGLGKLYAAKATGEIIKIALDEYCARGVWGRNDDR